jgi:hypothetical protein
MTAPRGGAIGLFVLALLALDAAIVAAVHVRKSATRAAPALGPAPSGPALDLEWALCQTDIDGRAVAPDTVAVTYLDGSLDADVTPEAVRSWFPGVPADAVIATRLEYLSGRRRIALELSRASWPEWQAAAGGARGRELCGRLRAALLARGIHRPDAPGDGDRSRHDFEFIAERRGRLYRTVQRIGTLDELAGPDALDAELRWLREAVVP